MKKRKIEALPKYPGIYRILFWNENGKRWEEPKRGKKFYAAISITSVSGCRKKKRKSFSSFDAAKEWRNSKESIVEDLPQLPVLNEMLFEELCERWKKDCLPHKARSTQVRYVSYFQHLDYFKGMKIENIQPTIIDGWITHIKKREYLDQFHNTRCGYDHEFSVLRELLKFYASRCNRNYRLPFLQEHKAMLKVKEKSKVEKDLNVDEVKKFFHSLKEICFGTKWEVIYYMSLMHYAIYGRLQDAAALHYEDFDMTRKTVSINKKAVWLRAKNEEDYIDEGSKANRGKVLPMSELASKVFKEWVLKSGIREGLLFHTEGKLLPYRVIEYRYTQALKRAGLPFRATHILRHAALTEFYDTCEDLLATQKMAGHNNIKSTVKYAKVRDKKVAEAQRRMDEKLSALEI